jgi:hypothetical protein
MDEIFARLDNLELPPDILKRAETVFVKQEYKLSCQTARARSDPKIQRPFTQAERPDGVRLALVNLPQEVYRKSRVWGTLMDGIESVDGFVRFVSANHSDTYPGFSGFLSSAVRRGKKWDFIPWAWVRDFLEERETIELVFKLPEPGQSSSMLKLDDLTEGDRKLIKEWLSTRAAQPGQVKPSQRLRVLADAAAWPEDTSKKLAGYGDDPDTLAKDVRDLAIEQGPFHATTHARYGDTYLGALLQALLPEAGYSDRRNIAELILRYNLVTRPASIAEINKSIAS